MFNAKETCYHDLKDLQHEFQKRGILDIYGRPKPGAKIISNNTEIVQRCKNPQYYMRDGILNYKKVTDESRMSGITDDTIYLNNLFYDFGSKQMLKPLRMHNRKNSASILDHHKRKVYQ